MRAHRPTLARQVSGRLSLGPGPRPEPRTAPRDDSYTERTPPPRVKRRVQGCGGWDARGEQPGAKTWKNWMPEARAPSSRALQPAGASKLRTDEQSHFLSSVVLPYRVYRSYPCHQPGRFSKVEMRGEDKIYGKNKIKELVVFVVCRSPPCS